MSTETAPDIVDLATAVAGDHLAPIAEQRLAALKNILAEQVLVLKETQALNPEADTSEILAQISALLVQIDTTALSLPS